MPLPTLKPRFIALVIVILLCIFSIWFLSLKPSNNKDWQASFIQLPDIRLQGDVLSIKNLRDFRYNSHAEVSEQRYLQRQYKLSELTGLWYGISHFAPHGLAHVFLSFEFGADNYLVVSIEARLEQRHTDGYNPLTGLFRQYTKTLLLATEEDVIGLRSHIRKEQVYLYPVPLSTIKLRALLLNYLREAEQLQTEPAFYNSFADNCMTGLLRATSTLNHWWQWLDYRIILPGYSDRLLFKLQGRDKLDKLQAWRAQHLIDPSQGQIADAAFSAAIRNH